jgi:lipoprotein-anchoring transpeptidase ErfK/SrfK
LLNLTANLPPLPASAPAGKIDAASLASRLAWQIALDRQGFSPGVIDGKLGRKARIAIEAFQRSGGLKPTGLSDQATAAALGVQPENALAQYAVQQADLDSVGDLPKGWLEKSKLKWLPYDSLDESLAERFHCSRALLAELNGGVDLASLKPGDTLVVPNVQPPAELPQVARLTVDLTEKVITIFAADKVCGLLHCSVAAKEDKLPSGTAKVVTVAPNPAYLFDPKHWPEVHGIDQKLLIPPGPRNPVGLCWIGLSKDGYGIHGTPAPEMIGKTGSHGCIRLANWDAQRLGKIVGPGVEVAFIR